MTPLAQHHHFNINTDMSELLNKELKVDGFYHPNLGGISRGGMANHYPMTLISMHELGASDQQLTNFKRQWPRNRALIDEQLGMVDTHQLTQHNWHLYLGHSQKLKEFRRIFVEKFSQQESENVISNALEIMKNGLPMGLFHPLIRLSFAGMQGDKGLLADALAYMAIRYHDIYQTQPMQKTQTTALSSWAAIRDLKQQEQLNGRLPNLNYGGSIHVCEQLCSSELVHQLALNNNFNISADTLKISIKKISKAAVQLYLSEPSLTTLHGVTACQALADMTQRYANNDHSREIFSNQWQYFWIWLTALFIEKGCTLAAIQSTAAQSIKVSKLKTEEELEWKQLSKAALSSNEVHIIKMVYSCKWLFEQIDNDPLYQQAAKTMT